MAKAQHASAYKSVPPFLKRLREDAGLTQRQLGQRLRRPQSWVYNCESSNRRVDLTEFIRWCEACETVPEKAFARFRRG